MKNVKRFKLSFWCKFFKKKEVLALYHSLSMSTVYLSIELLKILKPLANKKLTKKKLISLLGQKITNLLIQERFLIEDNRDEMTDLFNLRNRLIKKVKLNLMYLVVSDDCNLCCGYCFENSHEAAKNFLPQKMSEETARKAIDYFAKITDKYGSKKQKKVINIYGGEPLLNFKAVKAAVLRIAELKEAGKLSKNCVVAIVTNGLLLNDMVAKFFHQHNVSVGLSIDGPEKINNQYRLSKNAKVNVFERIMKAHKIAIANKLKIGYSVTLTPQGVSSFSEMRKFFLKKLDNQDGLSFNLLHYTPNIKVDEKYFKQAANFLIKSFKVFRKEGIYEERMMRKVKSFIEQKPMLADCGVVGNQIIISPDGQIGVCQDFVKSRKYFAGYLQDKDYDPIKNGLFKDWKYRSPFFMEKCFSCPALAICGGGCPAGVEIETGNRWNIDRRICQHSKSALKWLIWDAYQSI